MKEMDRPGRIIERLSFASIVCLALLLSGCGGNESAPPALTSIAISPDPVFVGAGSTISLTATGKYSNGVLADLTSQVVWTTADHLVATVSASGVVSAASMIGASTTLSASFGGVTSHSVTVTITSNGSSATTELGVGRYDHTATLLGDGRVLVTGGYNAVGALSSSELYDPVAGLWSPTGNLNTKRGDLTAVLLGDGRVLAVGGVDGINSSSLDPVAAELYDPVTATWSLTSSLNTGRSYHSATLLANGKVLVVGGDSQGKGILSSAEIFDPATASATGKWLAATSLATARDSHSATLLKNGKVLVAGGFDGTNALASVELYDPVADTWTSTGSLIKGRYTHTATLLGDGKVLIVGGSDSAGKDIATAEIYDPATGTWASTGSISIARYNHLAILMPNGQVMVMGGSNATSTFLSSVELYDPIAGKWSGAANLQTGRVVFSATLLTVGPNAGSVLVAGGDGAVGTLSSVELHN